MCVCVFVCAPLSSTLALLLFPKLYPAHDIFFLPSYKKDNLEMNKEGLAADLVCLLDERSKQIGRASCRERV